MEHYTFEIDGRHVGYLEVNNDGEVHYSRAVIRNGDTTSDNPFWIRYDSDRILAYRHGESDWIDLDGPSLYPSAALPLVASRLADGESVTFQLLIEDTGASGATVELHRAGNQVDEIVDGEPWRHVVLDGDRIIEFGWGAGAVSRLVGSRAEAVAGTGLD